MSFWDFLKLATLVFSSTGGLKVECLALFCAIEHLTFNYLFYIKMDVRSQKCLYSPLPVNLVVHGHEQLTRIQ